MNANELFEAGKLYDAIDSLGQELRSKPTDVVKRAFLAELLCFAGVWERADKQLDVIGHQDPEYMPGVVLLRQLLRAAEARQQFFSDGRLPEFLEAPSQNENIQAYLKMGVLLREEQIQETDDLLATIEQQRQPLKGICNDNPFTDFRDLDDVTAGLLEVLTSNGKYFWIALNQIQSIEFHPPKRPRDLLWRPARLMLKDDIPEGNVFIPTIYPTSAKNDQELASLGRLTDWHKYDGSATVRGVGQRMFLVGEDAINIMDIQVIKFISGENLRGKNSS